VAEAYGVVFDPDTDSDPDPDRPVGPAVPGIRYCHGVTGINRHQEIQRQDQRIHRAKRLEPHKLIASINSGSTPPA